MDELTLPLSEETVSDFAISLIKVVTGKEPQKSEIGQEKFRNFCKHLYYAIACFWHPKKLDSEHKKKILSLSVKLNKAKTDLKWVIDNALPSLFSTAYFIDKWNLDNPDEINISDQEVQNAKHALIFIEELNKACAILKDKKSTKNPEKSNIDRQRTIEFLRDTLRPVFEFYFKKYKWAGSKSGVQTPAMRFASSFISKFHKNPKDPLDPLDPFNKAIGEYILEGNELGASVRK